MLVTSSSVCRHVQFLQTHFWQLFAHYAFQGCEPCILRLFCLLIQLLKCSVQFYQFPILRDNRVPHIILNYELDLIICYLLLEQWNVSLGLWLVRKDLFEGPRKLVPYFRILLRSSEAQIVLTVLILTIDNRCSKAWEKQEEVLIQFWSLFYL